MDGEGLEISGADLRGKAPAWFQRAVATPGESRSVGVQGYCMHYLRWGEVLTCRGAVICPTCWRGADDR